ncbi:flagellar biosynthesis anti-sigma factor FlgM [uncultured Roseovarius sp.]|uniref:flagellar biosynthesis anti-sigma factor FlgM n=1 Tax=uncultured Roseovarius sp. TaxID=293344 RepID=UPI002616DD9A|nr:flagellar biosynthesis anti-sigma factor FlgM [uncultured Roseovarius sp.]
MVDSIKSSNVAKLRPQPVQTDGTAGPPFDAARVTRIKQAVAEDQYPVDAQRITDSIFQDYSALMR